MGPLCCRNLSKRFDGTTALDGLELALPPRGLVAIVGPNGAGKTTLLNILTGFLQPDVGEVFFDEQKITGLAPDRIVHVGIARTFQDLRLIGLISVFDNIMLASKSHRGEQLWRAITRIGIQAEEEANRDRSMGLITLVGLGEKANDAAGTLSYGQQKLLALACCIATDAQILLLDEPVAGLHPEMAEKILGLLQSLHAAGKLVVFIEHDIPAVKQIAERVIVMDHGKVIADGPPRNVLERPEILEAYVG